MLIARIPGAGQNKMSAGQRARPRSPAGSGFPPRRRPGRQDRVDERGEVPMICLECRQRHHEDCRGGNWCDCQHQPSPEAQEAHEAEPRR